MIEELLCVIEIPMGSRNKYEWDEERGMIVFDRFLSSSTVFPTDYGFVPVDEIGHFFVAYKQRENHDVRVTGWASRERAAAEIEEGYERFRRAHE